MIKTPVKILTLKQIALPDTWPGETPVEISVADDHDALVDQLPGQDVLLAWVFTPAMGAAADNLKLIQSMAAGNDRIDLTAVPPGCQVANVYEHEKPIAEWVIMSMIALDRELIKANSTIRTGSWEMFYQNYQELEGRTLGIVGLGRIGRRVAQVAQVFGMRVEAVTRTPPSRADAQAVGLDLVGGMDRLDDLIGRADFLLLALPLTTETESLIKAPQLALMKPDACLLNVGRAQVVDEQALFDVLAERRIRGAALDVWYHEPAGERGTLWPANMPFWELDNLIMTPHYSGTTHGMLRRRLKVAADNIDRLVRGEPLVNRLYP